MVVNPSLPHRSAARSLFCIGLLAALAFGGPALADEAKAAEAPPAWMVVHAGRLLDVPGERPRGPSTLLIRDGRIEAVRDGYVPVAEVLPEDVETPPEAIDLKNLFVLPGLMDMHVHLASDPDDKDVPEYGTSDRYVHEHQDERNDVYQLVTAIVNARKTLDAGYTTVRDVGSQGWNVFALRDGIRDGHLTGPRIVSAGHIIHVGADTGPGACSGVDSCRRATRAQIDMGADLIKVYGTCSGSKPCGTEHAPALFLADELRAVVETAATRDLRVAVHAHGTAGIRLAAESGVRSVEHGSYTDAATHEIMVRNGVFLVPTLSVHDFIEKDIENADETMRQVMQSFLDNHAQRTREAHRKGVRIASGSDAGVVAHGNNARELQKYVEAGLTPAEAIVTATVNAAALIGRENDLGTLEAGKIADLIAVAGDPLDDVAVLADVAVVIQAGRVHRDARPD